MKNKMIILTGPTAVGKTDLSIRLAKAVNGEIISADSMQVYRRMDIGTAKIRADEMCGVRHHLIDILEPTESFNAFLFKEYALEAANEIWQRGNIPIIVGGTGFYIQALLYDIDFSQHEDKESYRKELEQLAKELGDKAPGALHEKLSHIDPEAARQIHANNIKRVIRAIEYFEQTGEKISEHNEEMHQKESPYNFLYYVLTRDRKTLYERIDKRVDIMIANGLVKEIEKLKAMGCHRGQTSMQGLGYKEILDYLDGSCTLDEAVYILKRDTRHFAKRQLTWFRRERDVRWLDLDRYQGNTDLILKDILKDCEEKRIVLK